MIAEDRAGRPNDFVAQESTSGDQAECPFCVGHESLTPDPLLEVAGASGPWQVRVVPNKYPAVFLGQKQQEPSGTSVLGQIPQSPDGAHEVLIESPRHIQDITELTAKEMARVLRVYRVRLGHWSQDKRIEHATLFKNVGVAAGASLEHIHSQLIALPYVPPVIAAELQASQQYFAAHQTCVFCQLLCEELDHRERFVAETDRFVAFCAYAGRQPYETWILPKEHSSNFEQLADPDLESLALLLQQVVSRLRTQLGPLSYNLLLHTAPFAGTDSAHYHWHFELVPRCTQLAGFEWGAGMFINPLSPERAAARLRVE